MTEGSTVTGKARPEAVSQVGLSDRVRVVPDCCQLAGPLAPVASLSVGAAMVAMAPDALVISSAPPTSWADRPDESSSDQAKEDGAVAEASNRLSFTPEPLTL